MITLHVKGQIIQAECCNKIVADSLNVLEIKFMFSDGWDGMKKTAQFTQAAKDGEKPVTYNVLLDEFGTAAVPNEIKKGTVFVSVFGVLDAQRMTTAPLAIPVEESGFIGDGETPIPPTPDLYQQLIEESKAVAVQAMNDQRVALIDSLSVPFEERGENVVFHPVPDYPLEVITHFAPMQEGEGAPSPQNIRAISKRKTVNAGIKNTEATERVANMTLPDPMYSGDLNWKSGEMTSRAKYLELDGKSEEELFGRKWFLNENGDTSYFVFYLEEREIGVDGRAWMSHFDRLDTLGYGVPGVNVFRCWNTKGQFRIGLRPDLSIFTDLTKPNQTMVEFRAYLESLKAAGTPVQLVYETTDIQSTAKIMPVEILSMPGENTAWSDCGEVTVKGPMDAKHREAQQNARIAALEAAILNA